MAADGVLPAAGALGAGLGALAVAVVAAGYRSSTGRRRQRLQWLAAAVVVTATAGLAGAALSALVGWPPTPLSGMAVGGLVLPAFVAVGRSPRLGPAAERVLVHTIVAAGLVGLVGAVYLLVVIGLGRAPRDEERGILALSMAAAATACVSAFPARRRIEEWANERVYGERHAPDEALRTFGARLSRAVPMDELLLQLVESLRKTMHLAAAEIWTGADGRLTRAVSVPDRPRATLVLRGEARSVATRAHAQGNAWLQVWLPELLAGRDDRLVRSVSVAHLGELLGLIVLERRADDAPFSEEEDRVLVDLARQVGLSLHNVRLDSALQASLDELTVRNRELMASRARIVAAADESRRRIERDLHDGAQQHLVALSVKLGLVRTLLGSNPPIAEGLLDELRGDVQVTLTELRELAHGIYPALLRDRGLAEALRSAGNRSPLATTVEADGVGRYDTVAEAAVYFCGLEALQNAAKHAGDGARVRVAIGAGDGSLWFEVADDGAGFDPALARDGHGFVNMRDRLGAFGGELTVASAPGEGTSVRGRLPITPHDQPRPGVAPPRPSGGERNERPSGGERNERPSGGERNEPEPGT
jgi:signal transduction histidine kinase